MGNQQGGQSGENPGGFYIEGGKKIKHKQIVEADFIKLKVIGKGHFSKVLLVQKKSNKKFYAMKIMQKEKIIEMDDIDNIRTERVVLECFSHPYIVNLHYAFQTKTDLFLVMDFVNGGELYYHLVQERRFNEERVRLYCAEIFLALDYLHQHKIIYRDLKLENVLLDKEGHCVLTDFNFSKIITEDVRANTFCGTVDYIAPEVLLAEENRGKGYDYSVDFWSLGILCYELLYGLPPFYSTDVTEAYTNILSKPLTFPKRPNVSREGRDFIKKMLVRNPKKRLGSKEASEITSHPWFKIINFDELKERKVKPKFVPMISGPEDVRYVDTEFLSQPVDDGPSDVKYDPKMLSLMQKEFVGFSFSESPPKPSADSKEEGGTLTPPMKNNHSGTPPLSPIRLGLQGNDKEKTYSQSPGRFDRMIEIDFSNKGNSPPRALFPDSKPVGKKKGKKKKKGNNTGKKKKTKTNDKKKKNTKKNTKKKRNTGGKQKGIKSKKIGSSSRGSGSNRFK